MQEKEVTSDFSLQGDAELENKIHEALRASCN